jgi:hypothetical protein
MVGAQVGGQAGLVVAGVVGLGLGDGGLGVGHASLGGRLVGVGNPPVGAVGGGGVGVERVEGVAVAQIAKEVLLAPAREHRVRGGRGVEVAAGGDDVGLMAVGAAAGDLAGGEAAAAAVVADAHGPVGELVGVGAPGGVDVGVGRKGAAGSL